MTTQSELSMLHLTSWHYPFRHAAAKFRRGNPFRKISIGIIKGIRKISPAIPSSVIDVRPLDAPHISFAPTDSMVMAAVYWSGIRGYEGIISEVWKRLCSNSTSVLEIGANVGFFSVLGARERPKRYTAVEPLPNVAQILRANLHRNELDFVEVIEGAVVPSYESEIVQISVPDEGREAPVGSHLLVGVELSERSEKKVLSVRAYPVALLMEGRDLVKIDAEGIEAQLLFSARDSILKNKPTLIIEVLPEAENLGAMLSEIAISGGYNIYVIPAYGSDTLVPVPPKEFSSKTPRRFHSKDVMLSLFDLKRLELQF
jgi:FkbM family methyltransferase